MWLDAFPHRGALSDAEVICFCLNGVLAERVVERAVVLLVVQHVPDGRGVPLTAAFGFDAVLVQLLGNRILGNRTETLALIPEPEDLPHDRRRLGVGLQLALSAFPVAERDLLAGVPAISAFRQRPSVVRSVMTMRSNSEKEPSIWRKRRPPAVEVSNCSVMETKRPPFGPRRLSSTVRRSRSDRERR